MFSWFKFRTQDKSAEQLALELQTLCDEYDRRFGVFEHKYVEFSPIGLVALAVTFLFSVLLAGIAGAGIHWAPWLALTFFSLPLGLGIFAFADWLFENTGAGQRRQLQEQRELLIRRIQHKRAALVAALDRG